MNIPEKTDVLIVGAGPTGLMLANQLARQGTDFLIIDRHAGPSVETRALGVQARTLEIYSHLGIAERALELGKRAKGASMWANGKFGARVPLGDIGLNMSPYPFLLILGQDDNERLLGEVLRSGGNQIQWNTELIALKQQTDHVEVALKQTDGSSHQINAKWVAGCDGARSAVRELNKSGFPGAPYEHVFYVADTTITGPMHPDELNVFLFSDGFHLFFPMRGEHHWRVVGILPPELRGRDDVEFSHVLPSITKQAGLAIKFQECRWFSTYRIHHRHAERFRDRRCFLLGDAGHVHSPVGAQGMNTGLQDAYNLGWKLALVVSGRAAESLIDSYEKERLPVAENLVNTTDRGFALVVSDRWITKFFRTRILPKVLEFAMRLHRIRQIAFRTISQIGIRYPESPLSETETQFPDNAPHAGDRFPWLRLKFSANAPEEDFFARLDDTRFNLILVGQSAPDAFPQELNGLLITHEVPVQWNEQELARAGIPNPSFYLLRPDCYIGLAGTRFDPSVLSRYSTERLRLQPARV